MSTMEGNRAAAYGAEVKTMSLNDGALPLVRVFVTGHVADEDFRDYLTASDRLIKRGKQYVLLYDAMSGLGISPVQRRLQTDWIQRNRADLRLLCKGAAFAMTSAVMRGALTAILWVTPLPFETHVTSSLIDAERWTRERLIKAGIASD